MRPSSSSSRNLDSKTSESRRPMGSGSGSGTAPRNWSAVSAPGSSASASGLPSVAATRRSATSGAIAPGGRRQELQRLGGGEPGHVEAANALEAGPARRCRADRDDERDAVGVQPASDERQDRQRLVVEPLRVVDDHEDGLRPCCVGEQAQHREPDEVRVGRVVLHRAEHGSQRRPLRDRAARPRRSRAGARAGARPRSRTPSRTRRP